MPTPRRKKNPKWKPTHYVRIGNPTKRYDALAKEFLDASGAIFDRIGDVDTAVGDGIAKGLAYIVEAGYDCQATSLELQDEAFWSFTQSSTAEWFRSRGFAEWFCQGAGHCWRTHPPRIRRVPNVVIRKKEASK